MASFKYTQVSTVKIYACNKAIKISNPLNITRKASGTTPNTPILMTNPAITLSMVCPAIMFAASLTDKLIGLERYENNSINTSNGASIAGVPFGKKKAKKCVPCLISAMVVTAKNMNAANAKVTAIWLVAVKLYGNIPSKLQNTMNMNSEKINGKYWRPASPTLSFSMLAMNS